MTETKQRIEELKKALPNVREKVATVAMMFALSLTLMVSVSYAWYTLSMAPELSGVTTTISSNGSLEVALSDFDGEEPEATGVGDSFAAEGQTTHGANITWGNLINLAGGYGLESLTLRPAALDTRSESLLYGVKYSSDGRVEGVATDFGFTTWYQVDKTTNTWEFVAPSGYPAAFPEGTAFGVRAISSVAYEGNQSIIFKKLENANMLNLAARNSYNALCTDSNNVSVINKLVQAYLDACVQKVIDDKLGGGSGSNEIHIDLSTTEYIIPLTAMMEQMYDVVCQAGDALAYLANIQIENEAEATLTRSDILSMTDAELKAKGVTLSNSLTAKNTTNPVTKFLGYRALHDKIKEDMETMQAFATSGRSTIDWAEIEPVVNSLIHINSLTVHGQTIGKITGSGVSFALDFINNQLPSNPDVILYQGTLWNLEHIIGAYMQMNIVVNVNAMGIVKYNGVGKMFTSTSLQQNCMFADDKDAVEDNAGNLSRGIMKAQDTYGMVLDLWVRTNAEGSLLTLNGTPEIETYTEQRMVVITGESESRPVYIYNRPTGEQMEGMDMTEEVLVYIDSDGYCYNASTYSPEYKYKADGTLATNGTNPVQLTGDDVINNPKMDEKTRVIGFNASNRIWTDEDMATNPPVNDPPLLNPGEISSTQGSGSCYIFYADTPEASARSLELLSQLKFAFVDERQNLLGTAAMDVANVFAENGKYTVPIAITSSNYSVEDEDGNTVYGICALAKNVATRISVVVYLDGQGLENEMVMSGEDIVGTLNLQFDSTAKLTSIGDAALSYDVVSLSAELKSYDEDTRTAQLSAIVDGMEPAGVQAVFQRRINATQGTRMEPVDLDPVSGSNEWTGEVHFSMPGDYILTELLVDGVPYPLPAPVEVSVDGFDIQAVYMDESPVLTVERRAVKEVTITFASSDDMPASAQARFMTSDGHSVNASLRHTAGNTWTGTAAFTESDTYTLQYLVLDDDIKDDKPGEYYELPLSVDRDGDNTGDDWYRFTAYMGLTARVYLERYIYKLDANGDKVLDANGEPVVVRGNLDYILGEETDQTARITAIAEIYDDSDAAIKGLTDIVLYYAPLGSSAVENGFDFTLTWDGSRYTGDLSKAEKTGSFVFHSLQLGTSNALTTALSSPTLVIRAKDPPSFAASAMTDADGVIVTTGKQTYSALLDDASYARNYVVFENAAGVQYVQPFTASEVGYTAEFPSVGAYGQNDVWTVKKIVSAGITANGIVYDGAYTADTEDVGSAEFREKEAAAVVSNPTAFYEVKTKSGGTVPTETYTIVNTVTISMLLKDDETITRRFGKDSSGTTTGEFMEKYSYDDLTFTVNIPRIPQATVNSLVGTMTLNMEHGIDSMGKGGYNAEPLLIDPVTAAATNGVFTFSGELQLAGSYRYTASVSVGDVSFTNKNLDIDRDGKDDPVFEVWSVKPTLSIKEAMFASTSSNKAATPNGTTVTVYMYEQTEKNCGVTYYNYTHSYVKFTLTGYGKADSAVLKLTESANGTVYLYQSVDKNGETQGQTDSYEWNGNGDVTRYVGYLNQVTGNDKVTPAGTLKATELVLTNGGKSYSVPVTVQISNPAPR